MPFHSFGPVCNGCNQRAKTAHPYLQDWYQRVKAKYPNVHIACAWRDKADQDQAVRDGKSRAPWPTSNHNHMENGVGCSLALDLFLIDEDGSDRWPEPFYKKLNDENQQAHEPIRWGGTFTTISDTDHYELIMEKLPSKQS